MKNNQYFISCLSAIALLALCGFGCFINNTDNDFEVRMIRDLQLKFVNSDSTYKTTDLRVFGDTINDKNLYE